MGDSLRHFLLVFDHASAQLMQLLEFDTDAKKAMAENMPGSSVSTWTKPIGSKSC